MKSLYTDRIKVEKDDEENTWFLLDTDVPRVQEGRLKSCLSLLTDPNHRPYRYVIAILLSLIQFVLSFIPDLPGGLQATTIRVMKLDNAQYNMIFSAYTWVDIVMSLVGTVTVTRFLGMHLGFILFTILLFVGQVVCSLGCFMNTFWIYLLGRVIIGCGMGTTQSILNSFQILWFGGKEVTFIVAIGRSFCRFGATLALSTPQLIYDGLSTSFPSSAQRLGLTQMVGTLLTVMACIIVLFVILLDRHGAKVIGRRPFKKANFKLGDILRFPVAFWVVVIACIGYYGIVIPFTANAPLFNVSKYSMSVILANFANSLSYAAIIPVTPIIALIVEVLGYHILWGTAGIITASLVFILYAVGTDDQWVPFVGAIALSFSFSLFGTGMWVTPGLVVEKHQITTAYGIAMSMYAVAISLVSFVSGNIIDNFGYFFLILVFLIVYLLLVIMLMSLFVSEMQSNKRVLSISGKTRRNLHS